MDDKTKKILIGVLIFLLLVGLALGIYFGVKKYQDDKKKEESSAVADDPTARYTADGSYFKEGESENKVFGKQIIGRLFKNGKYIQIIDGYCVGEGTWEFIEGKLNLKINFTDGGSLTSSNADLMGIETSPDKFKIKDDFVCKIYDINSFKEGEKEEMLIDDTKYIERYFKNGVYIRTTDGKCTGKGKWEISEGKLKANYSFGNGTGSHSIGASSIPAQLETSPDKFKIKDDFVCNGITETVGDIRKTASEPISGVPKTPTETVGDIERNKFGVIFGVPKTQTETVGDIRKTTSEPISGVPKTPTETVGDIERNKFGEVMFGVPKTPTETVGDIHKTTSEPISGVPKNSFGTAMKAMAKLGSISPFSIRNKSGKCIHPSGGIANNGTELVIYDGCDEDRLKFEFTPRGSLKHKSGKCVHPNGGTAKKGVHLVYHDGCDEDRLKFEFTPTGALKHTQTGLCVHPENASSSNNTKLLLWDSCETNNGTNYVTFEQKM